MGVVAGVRSVAKWGVEVDASGSWKKAVQSVCASRWCDDSACSSNSSTRITYTNRPTRSQNAQTCSKKPVLCKRSNPFADTSSAFSGIASTSTGSDRRGEHSVKPTKRNHISSRSQSNSRRTSVLPTPPVCSAHRTDKAPSGFMINIDAHSYYTMSFIYIHILNYCRGFALYSYRIWEKLWLCLKKNYCV